MTHNDAKEEVRCAGNPFLNLRLLQLWKHELFSLSGRGLTGRGDALIPEVRFDSLCHSNFRIEREDKSGPVIF
jgi:hypothetical protein